MIKLLQKSRINWIIVLALLIPLIYSLKDIITGSIPFWYDPARDTLAALSNLKKPTLLGPPTGIPGVFYGPYWIWALSISLIFSKDPRFSAFLLQLLPYLTIFPLILYKLTENWGKDIFLVLWLLFILAFKNYTTFLWNPHAAPWLFLVLLYLISISTFKPKKRTDYYKLTAIGFTAGLITNFHMSFGIAIIIAIFVYALFKTIPTLKKNKKNSSNLTTSLKSLLTIAFGIILSFLPFIAFEIRHGFNQTNAMLKQFTDAVFHGTSEVALKGMTNRQIISRFLQKASELLQIPAKSTWLVYFMAMMLLVYQSTQKPIKLKIKQKSLCLFLFLSSLSLLSVYLSAKNPVWDYHFISVEIIFLLLLGFLMKKSSAAKKLLIIWTLFLTVASLFNFTNSLSDNPLKSQSFMSKKTIVERIFRETGESSFTYHAYSPSIYTFDFDYLFKWLAEKNNLGNPKLTNENAEIIYLIIPETSKPIELDFVNYKTPNDEYETIRKWKAQDKTIIYTRAKKS